MKIKKVSLKSIIDFLGVDLLEIKGSYDDNTYIDNLADIEHITASSLDWINPAKKNKQEIAENTKAKIILVDSEIIYNQIMQGNDKVLLVVNNPKVSLANIGIEFFVEKIKREIHPTAIIHPEAVIGENVSIGAYSVIGKSELGNNCTVDTNVRVYDDVKLGCNCTIKSNAVLGGEGFGYEKDSYGNRFRFPQIGRLIIGDFVEIGSNTCIDKGSLSDTIIESYTKINNLCHIAHNNIIGKNVIITAQVNISGSNIIEDNVWIAPNSSIKGWVKIGKGSTVGMGAVVVKNIPENEIWVGCPAKKLIK